MADCLFCKIVSTEVESAIIFEDENFLAFLDHRPLFLGHTLVVPKKHYETLGDLSESLVGPLFKRVQLLSQVVERAMNAEGTFVALNNRVSQSVPHLHVHVVPRKKGDGLKGFFWPRTKYRDLQEMEEVKQKIVSALRPLLKDE